jgi:hypothetical protein
METAEHAANGTRVVVLHELGREPELGELVSPENLHEEAALIRKDLRLEHNHVAKLS